MEEKDQGLVRDSVEAELRTWVMLLLVVAPVIQFMIIIGFSFQRIYMLEPALFVEVMNSFGSSFVQALAAGAGAGGVYGLIRAAPKIIDAFRRPAPARPEDPQV